MVFPYLVRLGENGIYESQTLPPPPVKTTARPFRPDLTFNKDPKALGPMKPPPPGRAEDIPGHTILQVKAQAL
jgi:hypothetical protein